MRADQIEELKKYDLKPEVLERLELTPLQARRLKEAEVMVNENYAGKKLSSLRAVGYLDNRTFSDGLACKYKLSLEIPDDPTQAPALVTEKVTAMTGERDTQNVYRLFKAAFLQIPGFREACNSEPDPAITTRYALKTPCSPVPFQGHEPPLRFRGKSLLGVKELKLTELVHSLGLGVPGSGKTHSYILPLITAFLDYELDGKHPSMAVIDPKAELLKPIKDELKRLNQSERLVVIGECEPFLFFRPDDGLHTKDRFYKVRDLVPGLSTEGSDRRWEIFAENLTIEWLKQDQEFLNASGLKLLESIMSVVELSDQMNVGQWTAMHDIYGFGMGGMTKLRMLSDTFTVLMHCVGLNGQSNPVLRYANDENMLEQWFYQARSATMVTGFASAPEINNVVDFDTRRYGADVKRVRLNIQDLIDDGKILVYQPAESQAHTVAGKALKTQFFQAIKERRDMKRPSAYICDEYHRFASLEDNSNLDITRAYRCVVIGATQSIEAMRLGLGGNAAAASAIAAMLTNMPTKLVFRSNDTETFARIKFLIPGHPQNQAHILDVRPPSFLNAGESYFVIGKRWGRSQFQLTTGAT